MRIDAPSSFFYSGVLFHESEILIALTVAGFAQIHLEKGKNPNSLDSSISNQNRREKSFFFGNAASVRIEEIIIFHSSRAHILFFFSFIRCVI